MMEQYDQVTNVKTKKEPHPWGETPTTKKGFHQRVLRENLRKGESYSSSMRKHHQRPDHHPFNRWWDLTFGDEEETHLMFEKNSALQRPWIKGK